MAEQIAGSTTPATTQKLHWWFGFGDGLEPLYRCEEAASHGRTIAVNWLIGLCIFDLFAINDALVTGPSFPLYLVGRLGICTPLALALLFMVRKCDRRMDMFASAVPVMASATLSTLLLFGHGHYRSDYLFGNLLLMVCGVTVSHTRLPWAALSVALQCICFEVPLQTSDILSAPSSILAHLYCMSAASVALLTSASVEQNNRRAFLLRLRVGRLNRELEEMTLKDPLTGLGNRRCLESAAQRLWAAGNGLPRQVSFILLDVDCFKLFNDNYGHLAGDVCLQAIARCVGCHIRQDTDLVIRFGGEEIVVLMPDTDLGAALDIAERIRRAIAGESIAHPALGTGAVVTASLGVASALTTACTCQQLVTRADTALYEAKNMGRNRVWPPPVSAMEVELVE